ncbi:MAG: C4-dicarboxylate ABC transporter [Deltaproteobacteria bacterium SG8_13]|nr:MAG: C4-dicarboxylate ABC transporter [Deltaproteobacteria bacterium SG8_13]
MTPYFIAFGLILATVFGMPLFAVILAVAMIGFAAAGIDLSVIAIEIYRLADTPLLVALPLFTLAGYVMAESRTSERLVRLTQAIIGWIPGGLVIVSLLACAVFTAFTGASGVTIVALGALLLPALKKAQYGDRFSLGLVTTSGSLGLLLPPSIPLVLYGIITQQLSLGIDVKVEDLFLAGLLPGLLMIILLIAWSLWAIRKNPLPQTVFSPREVLQALREAFWEVPLPIFILIGVYSGFLAISEAAAVAALYVIVVEVFVYKDIRLTQLPGIIERSMMVCGGILLIIGVSLASTNYLIDAEIPMKLFDLIQKYINNKLVFLILLNLFLLVLGAILDIFSALVIMVPLILPVAVKYGIDPVHFGIIFLANMQIGYFTPPVGMNLFIASYRFNLPVDTIYRSTLPFMLVLLTALLVITYWPGLSLMLLQR